MLAGNDFIILDLEEVESLVAFLTSEWDRKRVLELSSYRCLITVEKMRDFVRKNR